MAEKTKKQLKREKLAELIGKTSFAQKAYKEKQEKAKKPYSLTFADVLRRMEKESYNSIDYLPILKWEKIAKTGNMKLLLKEEREVNIVEANALKMIYTNMRDEFIKVFGWPEDKQKAIELMQEIVYRNLVLQATGDIQQLTFIEIAELSLNELLAVTSEGVSLVDLCVALEEVLKIPIDLDKCSVAKFYGYINRAKKKAA